MERSALRSMVRSLFLVVLGALLTPPSVALSEKCTFGYPIDSIDGALSLIINDKWNGLSPDAPIIRRFYLLNKGENFDGWGLYSSGTGQRMKTKTFSKVSVPYTVVKEAYAKLKQASFSVGKYEPRIEHTDDYPRLTIDLNFGDRNFMLHSSSQGKARTPWSVSNPYPCNTSSHVLNEAWEMLNAHLPK